MATIKEMAAKHNLCNNDQTTMAYRLGAIEVLEEIENILATEFIAGRVATDRLRLLEIYNKIKELKGE